MVRRELTRDAAEVAGLALESVLVPVGGIRVFIHRPLDDDLDALLGDGAECAVGVAELPAVEARVHQLSPREQVAQRSPADHHVEQADRARHDEPGQRDAVDQPRRIVGGAAGAAPMPGIPIAEAASTIVAQLSHAKLPVSDEPQLRRDDDRRGHRADDRRDRARHPEPEQRREQEPRHDQLREVVAERPRAGGTSGGGGAPAG